MTKMVKCPTKGCKIMIPDDRMCCTKHWYEATDEKRVAKRHARDHLRQWMRRRNRSEEE